MEPTKVCTKCKQTKPIVDFHCDARRPLGRRADCKKCHAALKEERLSTAEGAKARRAAVKRYDRSEKAKLTREEYARRRTERLALATPGWASQSAIARIYAEAERLTVETGVKHEVHHVFPLLEYEPLFCGLHVPANLEIVTAEEHIAAHSELRHRFGKQHAQAKKMNSKY